MKKLRSIGGVMILFILFIGPVSAQEKDAGIALLRQGIEYYKQSDFRNALIRFREILGSPASATFHGDAYFWIAKANMSLGRYDEASKNLEHFLKTYGENPYFPEGVYEKGRLLFLQGENESALQVLQGFIASYPDSPYIANAYYWAGESLYALGDLKSAERMFRTVVSQHPTSFRVEAAQYRISLIEIRYREEELLKLLKWSHEEYLKALEEFQKRETTYEEAIAAFQRKIAALASQDFQGEIVRMSERIRVLEAELGQAKSSVESLMAEKKSLQESLAQLRGGSGRAVGVAGPSSGEASAPQEVLENRMKAVAIKEEALLLKEFYLEGLINASGGKTE